MAWISVHQQISDHRKVRALFRELNISRQEAIGILVLIWTWAIDNCDKDGMLISVTKEDICNAAYWKKNHDKLYDALVKTGWLDEDDGDVFIHDWYDFNKPYYCFKERKEKDVMRKREARKEEKVRGHSADIPQTIQGLSTDIPRTFHYSQEQEQEQEQEP